MSTTAGVWSETALQAVRMRADAIMFDDRLKKDYEPRIDIINAMQRINTARILPLNDGRKNYTVELMWMNNCAITAGECTTCSYSGAELSTNAQQYTLDKCKEAGFTVQHYDMWTNDFGWEEAIAKGMLTVEIRLIAQVVQDYLTTIYNGAGVNQWNGDAAIATVVGNETRIAPVNYTAARVAYLTKVAQFNQFNTPIMLSGDLLWNDYHNALYNAGSFADVGNKARYDSMEWYWDVYNFNLLGLDLYQLMVNVGATAFASRGIYTPTPVQWGDGTWHWSAPSRFFPELIIDWNHQQSCSNDQPQDIFVGKAHWANLINPEGCTENNNGILLFHSI